MDMNDVLEAFEEAWSSGTPPDLERFVRSLDGKVSTSKSEMSSDLIAELIRIDLYHRWRSSIARAGDGNTTITGLPNGLPVVEDYVSLFPQHDLQSHIFELIQDEVSARLSTKVPSEFGDLRQRFPDQSSGQLRAAHEAGIRQVPHDRSAFLDGAKTFEERFEVRRVLGQGGMGRVYLAFDPRLQREVAVKVPIMDLRHDDVARERFIREGRLAASFTHPNVVVVYEIGELDQQCFIVAEYVEGPTLHQWLLERTHPLSSDAAANLICALARGIQAAHRRGVLHRDLKPTNVLLEIADEETDVTEGWVDVGGQWVRPRITDFGLASCADELSALTTSGAVLGTAAYMAPEQATGQPIGPQADVYALGLILYECLFGARPFDGFSFIDVVDRFRGGPSVSLPTVHSIPADLATICERCLQFHTEDRYASAEAVEADLRRFVSGQPPKAKPVSFAAKLRQFASMPARISQAAYCAIIVEASVTVGFAALWLAKVRSGDGSGILIPIETLTREIVLMMVFPTLPVLVCGILTVRRKLWAFFANCAFALGMLGIAVYSLITGHSAMTIYADNALALTASHSLILGVSIAQVGLHLLAIPAALRIRRHRYLWV